MADERRASALAGIGSALEGLGFAGSTTAQATEVPTPQAAATAAEDTNAPAAHQEAKQQPHLSETEKLGKTVTPAELTVLRTELPGLRDEIVEAIGSVVESNEDVLPFKACVKAVDTFISALVSGTDSLETAYSEALGALFLSVAESEIELTADESDEIIEGMKVVLTFFINQALQLAKSREVPVTPTPFSDAEKLDMTISEAEMKALQQELPGMPIEEAKSKAIVPEETPLPAAAPTEKGVPVITAEQRQELAGSIASMGIEFLAQGVDQLQGLPDVARIEVFEDEILETILDTFTQNLALESMPIVTCLTQLVTDLLNKGISVADIRGNNLNRQQVERHLTGIFTKLVERELPDGAFITASSESAEGGLDEVESAIETPVPPMLEKALTPEQFQQQLKAARYLEAHRDAMRTILSNEPQMLRHLDAIYALGRGKTYVSGHSIELLLQANDPDVMSDPINIEYLAIIQEFWKLYRGCNVPLPDNTTTIAELLGAAPEVQPLTSDQERAEKAYAHLVEIVRANADGITTDIMRARTESNVSYSTTRDALALVGFIAETTTNPPEEQSLEDAAALTPLLESIQHTTDFPFILVADKVNGNFHLKHLLAEISDARLAEFEAREKAKDDIEGSNLSDAQKELLSDVIANQDKRWWFQKLTFRDVAPVLVGGGVSAALNYFMRETGGVGIDMQTARFWLQMISSGTIVSISTGPLNTWIKNQAINLRERAAANNNEKAKARATKIFETLDWMSGSRAGMDLSAFAMGFGLETAGEGIAHAVFGENGLLHGDNNTETAPTATATPTPEASPETTATALPEGHITVPGKGEIDLNELLKDLPEGYEPKDYSQSAPEIKTVGGGYSVYLNNGETADGINAGDVLIKVTPNIQTGEFDVTVAGMVQDKPGGGTEVVPFAISPVVSPEATTTATIAAVRPLPTADEFTSPLPTPTAEPTHATTPVQDSAAAPAEPHVTHATLAEASISATAEPMGHEYIKVGGEDAVWYNTHQSPYEGVSERIGVNDLVIDRWGTANIMTADHAPVGQLDFTKDFVQVPLSLDGYNLEHVTVEARPGGGIDVVIHKDGYMGTEPQTGDFVLNFNAAGEQVAQYIHDADVGNTGMHLSLEGIAAGYPELSPQYHDLIDDLGKILPNGLVDPDQYQIADGAQHAVIINGQAVNAVHVVEAPVTDGAGQVAADREGVQINEDESITVERGASIADAMAPNPGEELENRTPELVPEVVLGNNSGEDSGVAGTGESDTTNEHHDMGEATTDKQQKIQDLLKSLEEWGKKSTDQVVPPPHTPHDGEKPDLNLAGDDKPEPRVIKAPELKFPVDAPEAPVGAVIPIEAPPTIEPYTMPEADIWNSAQDIITGTDTQGNPHFTIDANGFVNGSDEITVNDLTDAVKDYGRVLQEIWSDAQGRDEYYNPRQGDLVVKASDFSSLQEMREYASAHPDVVGVMQTDAQELRLAHEVFDALNTETPNDFQRFVREKMNGRDEYGSNNDGMFAADIIEKHPEWVNVLFEKGQNVETPVATPAAVEQPAAAPVEQPAGEALTIDTFYDQLEERHGQFFANIEHDNAAKALIEHYTDLIPGEQAANLESLTAQEDQNALKLAELADTVWEDWLKDIGPNQDPMKLDPRDSALGISPAREMIILQIQGIQAPIIAEVDGRVITYDTTAQNQVLLNAINNDEVVAEKLLGPNADPDGALARMNIEYLFEKNADAYQKAVNPQP